VSTMVEYPLSSTFKIEDAIYFIFKEHALFGRTSSAAVAPETNIMLDNANWAKLLLGAPNLVTSGGTFRRSDIDIIFARARKSERRLDYATFLHALSLVAVKKFPEDSPIDAFSKLCSQHIFGVLHNQTASTIRSSTIVSCAILGVPVPPQNPSLSSSASGGGLPGGSTAASHQPPPPPLELRARALGVHAGERNRAGGIFDKLSSVDTYTGVYRSRFDEQGRHISGAINGYSGDVSGQIRDLKELVRTDIRANKNQFDV
jgi:hypothetical protein